MEEWNQPPLFFLFFFFLELTYFNFTSCHVLKLVLISSRWTEFRYCNHLVLCGYDVSVELYPTQHLLMRYINLLLDLVDYQRRIILVDICTLFLCTLVMEAAKLKDPEGLGSLEDVFWWPRVLLLQVVIGSGESPLVWNSPLPSLSSFVYFLHNVWSSGCHPRQKC